MKRLLSALATAALLLGCTDVVQTLPTPSPPTATQPAVTPGPVTTVGPVSPTLPPLTLPTAPPGTTPPDATPGPGTPTDPGTPTADNARLIAATVQIVIFREGPGGLGPAFAGSGTIISPDGLIVTNAHIAAPDAPGLAALYGEIGGSAPAAHLEIRITEREDQPPVARYRAEVLAADGHLDIAVIRISTTLDGTPVGDLSLPWLEIGDSDALQIGDPVTVIGFPAIGGDTVSADQGDVSGFLDDPKLGTRGWIKTSAVVHSGNSGGLGANAQGQLVGVPTRARDDVGGFGHLRPIKLARPVIDAAINGVEYGPSPYVVAGTGQEQVQFFGWLGPEATACTDADTVTGYATGATVLKVALSWSGFTSGLDFMRRWLYQDPRTEQIALVFESSATWEVDASGECLIFTLSSRNAFPDGTYGFLIAAGPQLRLVGDSQVTVGGAAEPGPEDGEGVLLSGRILDANSGRPVPGAQIVVLAPGEDIEAFLAGGDALAVAQATTDADGQFTLNNRIAASTQFPVVILARDYRTWAGTLTTSTEDGSLDEVLLTPVGP